MGALLDFLIQNEMAKRGAPGLMSGLFGPGQVNVTPSVFNNPDAQSGLLQYNAQNAAGMYDPNQNGAPLAAGLLGPQTGAVRDALSGAPPITAFPYLQNLMKMASDPASQAELQGKNLSNEGAGLSNQASRYSLMPYQAFYGDGGAQPGQNAQAPQQNVPPPQNIPQSGLAQQMGFPTGGAGGIPMAPIQPPQQGQAQPQQAQQAQQQGNLSPKPGIPIPPGWTPLQAFLAGPAGVTAAYQKFTGPQNVRPGGSLQTYNFGTGKYDSSVQQPGTPPPGFTYDANTNSMVPIGGGLNAVSQSEAAQSAGKAAGEYPYQAGLANLGAANTRTNEGFRRGLEVATTLIPSYDPATQLTTMVTQADALAQSKAGSPVTAPPPGAPAPAPNPNLGLQSDGSYKTTNGTVIPPAPKPTARPGGFQAGPSAADAATQSVYAETIKGWNDSVQPAAQAEERFQAMGGALKQIQSGAWAEHKANIGATLIAAGMSPDTVKSILNTDPAQAQIIIKNNFSAALSQLSAGKLGRITQNEIFALQKNLANPSLQPEANLAIIGQGIGIARYQQALANDWNNARQMGYADPLSYQQQWMKANPLNSFIDKATKEVGPLKGMSGGDNIPQAAIEHLRSNPNLAPMFDQKYGAGASKRALGQ